MTREIASRGRKADANITLWWLGMGGRVSGKMKSLDISWEFSFVLFWSKGWMSLSSSHELYILIYLQSPRRGGRTDWEQDDTKTLYGAACRLPPMNCIIIPEKYIAHIQFHLFRSIHSILGIPVHSQEMGMWIDQSSLWIIAYRMQIDRGRPGTWPDGGGCICGAGIKVDTTCCCCCLAILLSSAHNIECCGIIIIITCTKAFTSFCVPPHPFHQNRRRSQTLYSLHLTMNLVVQIFTI